MGLVVVLLVVIAVLLAAIGFLLFVGVNELSDIRAAIDRGASGIAVQVKKQREAA